MRKARRLIAAAIAVVALVVVPTGAQAADFVYVSGPASPFTGFAIPATVVPAGSSLTYVNLDIFGHDFVAADAYGSDANPWCAENAYPLGRCPAFWTPVLGLAAQAPVQGVAALPPGTYRFKCNPHPNMVGTLVVV